MPSVDPLSVLNESVAEAIARLTEASVRDETLAEYIPPRRVVGIMRQARMRELARVWRLGALLVEPGGALHGTGVITTPAEPGRPTYQSVSREMRREYQVAAFRGRLTGTVDFDAVPIDLNELVEHGSSGPLSLSDGVLLVRWSPAAGAALVPLDAYLRERVDLAVSPPLGA